MDLLGWFVFITDFASSDKKAITQGRLSINRQQHCIRNLGVHRSISVHLIVLQKYCVASFAAPLLDCFITRQAGQVEDVRTAKPIDS